MSTKKRTTADLYDQTVKATQACIKHDWFVAAAILCFALHEAIAAARYGVKLSPKNRFYRLAREHLRLSVDTAGRLWKARSAVFHAFGTNGNVRLIQRHDSHRRSNFHVDEKGLLNLVVEDYFQALKAIMRRTRARGFFDSARQFREE